MAKPPALTSDIRSLASGETIAYDSKGQPLSHPYGVIMFEKDCIEVDACDEEVEIEITVHRVSGTMGEVSCHYRMHSISALPGYDFHQDSGDLIFPEGCTQQTIAIGLFASEGGDGDELFQVILTNVMGGAIFNPSQDGGMFEDVLTIIIK